MDKPLKSVTHGQCDARPTVTDGPARRFAAVLYINGVRARYYYRSIAETHDIDTQSYIIIRKYEITGTFREYTQIKKKQCNKKLKELRLKILI